MNITFLLTESIYVDLLDVTYLCICVKPMEATNVIAADKTSLTKYFKAADS